MENTAELQQKIIDSLASLAVQMDSREFSREEYNRLFPRGTVETPLGTVKLGANQFEKLEDKDQGKRQGLIGAMYQTLSDPVAIIRETQEGKEADVFIKSFCKEGEAGGFSTVMSIVVDIEGQRIAISTYKRKAREVIKKIKKADGIVYVKDGGGSRTNRD
jgi:hypothetical protein